MKLYLIGSLRNPDIPTHARALRAAGFTVFDDWFAAGPTADDCWQSYSKQRGQSYSEALASHAAQHIFHFDKRHLDSSDAGVLIAPAGRSAYLEAGYLAGRGVPVFIYYPEEPERWDVMANFGTVCLSIERLVAELHAVRTP